MNQNLFNLIRLLDPYADAHTIDTRLNQDPLAVVSGHDERVQENFWRSPGFYFGNIVSLGDLRREVGKSERGGEGAADAG